MKRRDHQTGLIWARKRALNAAHQRNGLSPLDREAIVQLVTACNTYYDKYIWALREANEKQREIDRLKGEGEFREESHG